MFCITDPAMHDNPIVYVSDGFIDMTGYNRYEINGINCRFLQGHDTSPEDVDVIRTALKERKHARVCLLNYRKDGTRFINQFNISPLRDVDGELAYFIGVQMQVEDTEIMPFPNTRQSMAEMLVEAEREEMARSFEQVAN
ncbi:structural basis For light-dependent signaling in the dimeric Lov Photosensor Ytva [Tribonema minus]|uniref:Structural basis For light-dependent signaling in the dimeric Lov Photosensor Ytva n=1 Tax=Tribonema minus TaxID=303371 RepID=A0A836CEL0_9STRA|nr:structural basis For light-dependent signaling in the dimeric Lov Photosensor Ytva [Tribonema minus]